MTLLELREKIESLGETMTFKITDVFSWRGVYALPACSISNERCTKEHNLAMIDRLMTEVFEGWKGGEYIYEPFDEINFEPGEGSYTNGGYLKSFLKANAVNEDIMKIFL